MRSGGIPKKVALFVKAAQPFEAHNPWMKQIRRTEVKALTVKPAMPTDADSAQQRATAEEWASERRGTKFTIEERANTPFKVRIIGLETRGEGGRAYKVLTEDGLLIDMREEVLLDCIMSVGVEPGGTPRGEFIYAREGSQMKIVRVGSEIHQELTQAETRRTKSSISKSQLKPGVLYRTRGPSCVYYLGRSWKNGPHLSIKVSNYHLERRPAAELIAQELQHNFHNLHSTASLSVVEAAEEIPLAVDFAATLRGNARAHVLLRLSDKAYGIQKISAADKARHARHSLESVALAINFDPEAAQGTKSKEYAEAFAAIEQLEAGSK